MATSHEQIADLYDSVAVQAEGVGAAAQQVLGSITETVTPVLTTLPVENATVLAGVEAARVALDEVAEHDKGLSTQVGELLVLLGRVGVKADTVAEHVRVVTSAYATGRVAATTNVYERLEALVVGHANAQQVVDGVDTLFGATEQKVDELETTSDKARYEAAQAPVSPQAQEAVVTASADVRHTHRNTEHVTEALDDAREHLKDGGNNLVATADFMGEAPRSNLTSYETTLTTLDRISAAAAELVVALQTVFEQGKLDTAAEVDALETVLDRVTGLVRDHAIETEGAATQIKLATEHTTAVARHAHNAEETNRAAAAAIRGQQ